MNKGKIVQVMGPVVDVAFEDGNLPHIQDALTVDEQWKDAVSWKWHSTLAGM